MTNIHTTAIIGSGAEISDNVEIGPYSVIGEHVRIGMNTKIGVHTIIEGNTEIGDNNKISHFVTIGTPPQDIGYKGEDTRVIIGNNNTIREYTTVHRATTKQNWVTVVGNNNYNVLLPYSARLCFG